MQKASGTPLASARESSSIAAMRSVSNTALVQEAAAKALTSEDLKKTIARFRELCVAPGEDIGPLETTAEVLRNAGYKQELMNLLHEALHLPNANPHVGAVWIRRIVGSKIWNHRYPEGLDALCKQGEVGRRAVIEFLDLVGPKRRSELVRQAISRHAKWLRTDPRGWAAAGRALAQARWYSRAARWMADWRTRPEPDLQTLQWLALSLRAGGRMKLADEVVRFVLAKPGAAESFPLFKLWAAQDAAFAGDVQNASVIFKQIDTAGWDDDMLACYYLVRGVIRVQKANISDRKEAFGMARERLGELFHRRPIYKRDVFLRREYRRCLTRMAKDSRDWRSGIRAVWRSAESPAFLVPLAVVPGLQLLLPCYLYRLCARRRGAGK